eukprot:3745779-Prymnesium_polylepis.1
MNSAFEVRVASAPRPSRVPSRSCTSTCFGPSQSLGTGAGARARARVRIRVSVRDRVRVKVRFRVRVTMATQSSIVIQARSGGVKTEMLRRLLSSIVMLEKNCGMAVSVTRTSPKRAGYDAATKLAYVISEYASPYSPQPGQP